MTGRLDDAETLLHHCAQSAGDRAAQVELLAACLACWAPAAPPALRPELGLGPAATDVDDATLEKLAEFAGRQGAVGLGVGSGAGLGLGELIDVAGEAGLSPTACLRLCERLLADSGGGGGGGSPGGGGVLDAATWARQKAVLLKCAVLQNTK